MKKLFIREIIILTLLIVLSTINLSHSQVFAEDGEDDQNCYIEINVGIGDEDDGNFSSPVNCEVRFNAVPREGGNFVEETGESEIQTGRQKFSYGTEVSLEIEVNDIGGKAIYDEEREWLISIGDYDGNMFDNEDGEPNEDGITLEEVKEMLNLDSLYIKDYLQDDGKTFSLKFTIDEKHKEVQEIFIYCPIGFQGEIKPKAVTGENNTIEDSEVEFKFSGEGYNGLSERHFVKHQKESNIEVKFPREYVFDKWKFTDFADNELSRVFSIVDLEELKNNPVTIKPNFNDYILKNKNYDVNIKAILKSSPTVTFDPNFEDLQKKLIQTNSGKIVLPSANDFVRSGYIISEWNTEADGSGDSIVADQLIEEDITVYAQWIEDENAIFITLDLNYEGAEELPSIVAKEDGTIILPLAPEREDYKFIGWFTKRDTGEKVTESTVFNESTTIYAHWKKIDYITLKFLIGDDEFTSFKIDKEFEIGNRIPEIKEPIEGYFFRGWFTEKDGKGVKITTDIKFSDEIETEKNIYAYLLKVEQDGPVRVSFNYVEKTPYGKNTKRNTITANSITGDINWFIPEPGDDRIFKGWYTEEKGGEKIEEGHIFLKDTQLYAQWQKGGKIIIKFDLNGGESEFIPPIEIEYEGTITLPTEIPSRTGYEFIGWFDSKEGGNKITEDTVFTEDTTIYAQWEKISSQELNIIEVLLKKDDKIIARGKIEDINITILVNLSDEEINQLPNGNYTLIIRSSEGTEVEQEGGYRGDWSGGIINSIWIDSPTKFTVYGDNDKSKDYILTIKRDTKEPETYTISFNTMGGSTISPIKVKEGETIPIPKEPTREGYKFAGWYKDVLCRYEYDFNTIVKDDRELFAKWEKSDSQTPKPSEKKDARINKFSLAGIPGVINHDRETIDVYLPFNIDLDYLVPDISYEGEEIYPSISKPQDFNKTVYYTIKGRDYNSKTYKVYVNMPRDRHDRQTYYEDWYNSLLGKTKGKSKDAKDWYEISQEIKKKRLEEEKKPSLTSKEVKAAALKEVGQITAQSGGIRRDVSIKQFSDHMEVKQNSKDKSDFIKNQINIPSGVLTELNELGFDYLKYSTNLVRVKIFPFMDSADGVIINIRPAPSERNNDIQYIWAKTKGAGKLFEIETNSTKAGLSFEMKLDKKLPAEYIRVVKFNYMRQKFEDLSPEKWSIVNERVYVEQVSGGIYGIIYKK